MYQQINTKEIYGLRTVNCGEVIEFDTCDPVNPMRNLIVEVLRPEKHNPNAQIMCYYTWDTDKCIKVEITIYRDLKTGMLGSEIYYFHGKHDLQHYRSSNHFMFKKLPKKYVMLVKHLQQAFTEIYG